jgi:hypothetical protein
VTSPSLVPLDFLWSGVCRRRNDKKEVVGKWSTSVFTRVLLVGDIYLFAQGTIKFRFCWKNFVEWMEFFFSNLIQLG